MKKTIRLLDYANREKIFVINDFEKVKTLVFEIISGDGILTLVYQGGKLKTLDSLNSDFRNIDFHDGRWILEPKDIDLINEMKHHKDTDKLDEVEEGYENIVE